MVERERERDHKIISSLVKHLPSLHKLWVQTPALLDKQITKHDSLRRVLAGVHYPSVYLTLESSTFPLSLLFPAL